MSSETPKKFIDETTESWRITGQELMEFVLKTSESLQNVINSARVASTQGLTGKKSVKRKGYTKNHKTKFNTKKFCFTSNTETNSVAKMTSDEWRQSVPTQSPFDYDLEWTSSSCEELNDIPMEELLSSPTWKQIVKQNEFVWP